MGTTTKPLHASRLSLDTDTDPSVIVTAAKQTITDGNFQARLSDALACGGVIVTGAPGCIVEGKLAARVGDAISHGSVLMTGSDKVVIGNVGG
ncbi:MAG: PAAR domain-containing protein [Acidobacteria bacterium]|nr:PAAR domain-containing protein [Acidobacteriota bacterium]